MAVMDNAVFRIPLFTESFMRLASPNPTARFSNVGSILCSIRIKGDIPSAGASGGLVTNISLPKNKPPRYPAPTFKQNPTPRELITEQTPSAAAINPPVIATLCVIFSAFSLNV